MLLNPTMLQPSPVALSDREPKATIHIVEEVCIPLKPPRSFFSLANNQ
jgi:hypothetical protein